MAGAQFRLRASQGPPLVAPSGVAALGDELVAVGSAGGRVHVFRPDGRFVRGFLIERDAGAFRMRADAAGELEIATQGSGRLHRFDREGKLVGTGPDPEAYARFGDTGERRAEAPGGAVYTIEDGGLVRAAPPPRSVLVARPPEPLAWFAPSPVPVLTLLLTASGLGLVFGVAFSGPRRPPAPGRAA